MPAWEYITTPLLIHNTAAILNNWGSEGWELVQVVQGPEGGLVAYLKRPRADEASAAAGNEYSRLVEQHANKEGAVAVVISAKIESEIAVLPPEERADYLDAIGLKEPGLNKLISAGYDLLHLVTFFTAGPKEARAWTVTSGSKAP